jgi:hypothetical protein
VEVEVEVAVYGTFLARLVERGGGAETAGWCGTVRYGWWMNEKERAKGVLKR